MALGWFLVAIVMAVTLISMLLVKLQNNCIKRAAPEPLPGEKLGPEAIKALEKLQRDLKPFTRFGFHSNQAMGVYDMGMMDVRRAILRDRENAVRRVLKSANRCK